MPHESSEDLLEHMGVFIKINVLGWEGAAIVCNGQRVSTKRRIITQQAAQGSSCNQAGLHCNQANLL